MNRAEYLEALAAIATERRERLHDAAMATDELYEMIAEGPGLASVREIAKATRLSPGRVNQIQHGR